MSEASTKLNEIDLEAAKAMIAAQAEQLAAQEAQVAAQREEIRAHLEELVVLRGRIEWLKRQVFGRRSEKARPQDAKQLLFEFAALQAAAAAPSGGTEVEAPEEDPAEWEEIHYKREKKKAKGHGRAKIPEGLPRIRDEHPLPPEERACGGCGDPMEKIGEVVREELDFIPAALFVRQHVRFKYGCKATCCQERPPVAAPPPVRPIDRGRAGPGLLAQVLVGKYEDHLPLNRLEKVFKRHGAAIRRSSMCDWVGACADALRPLYEHLKKEALASRIIHTDDTEVPVLEPGKGQVHRGRLWVYIGDDRHPYVVFDYTRSRSRDGPLAFLAGFEGYLQADAYAGYRALYRERAVTEVACWAHTRRKFHDAQPSDRARATQALGYIRALYAIERRGKGLDAPARQELREEHARPLLARFAAWLEDAHQEVLPRGPMGEAVAYARNLWPALNRYLEDGELAIDNNASEREMKAVVIGRKNWMFAGSDAGGERAAIIYSVIRSARRQGMDPYRYLADVLERIRLTPPDRIADLAPDRWLEADQAASAEAPPAT